MAKKQPNPQAGLYKPMRDRDIDAVAARMLEGLVKV